MVNKKPSRFAFFREVGGGSPLPSSASRDAVSIPYSSLEYDLRDLSSINKALTLLNRRLVRLEVNINTVMLKLETLDIKPETQQSRMSEQDIALVEMFIARKLKQTYADADAFITSVREGDYRDKQ